MPLQQGFLALTEELLFVVMKQHVGLDVLIRLDITIAGYSRSAAFNKASTRFMYNR